MSDRLGARDRPAPTSTIAFVFTVPTSFTLIRGLPQYLADLGYEVHLIAGEAERGRVPPTLPGATGLHTVGLARSWSPLRDLAAVVSLALLFRRLRVDIVHASTPKAALLGTLAARLCGISRRIVTIRGLPAETATGLRRLILYAADGIALRLATGRLATSCSLATELRKRGIAKNDSISVLANGSSNGVDSAQIVPVTDEARAMARERLGIRAEGVVLGFIGRMVRDKGIPELIETWKRVSERNDGLCLVVAGSPDTNDPSSAGWVDLLQRDRRVHLLGWTPDVHSVLAALDVVVLPTHREGFPNIVLEASAAGLPVVATSATGCVDAILDGVTGLLVPVGDVDALTAAIMRLVDDDDLRKRLGEHARRRVVKDFTPEAIWRELTHVYDH